MKLPALQFYVGDWRKDVGVQCLNHHQKGVWLEMLFLMHESEERGKLILKGKAMTEDQIAHVLGLDKQIFKETLTLLLTSGVADLDPYTGAVISRRMVRDENLRKIRTECGKQGGNPNLLKQKRTNVVKVPPNQIHEDENEDEGKGSAEGKTEPVLITQMDEMGLTVPESLRSTEFLEIFNMWIPFRLKKEKPKDPKTMFRLQLDMLSEYPVPEAVEIVKSSIRNNWQGLIRPKNNINGSGSGHAKPESVWELNQKIEAKKTRMAALKRQHYADIQGLHGGKYMPAGWRCEKAQVEHNQLSTELQQLTERVSKLK